MERIKSWKEWLQNESQKGSEEVGVSESE
ncbi:uncharacterized protein G2W53_038576 [Senna tora]|uniref:Uncharacterized protein n=1 Tax=Senna tora TaxID=362788 RepID=A0A834SP98_9FABA|nr:uncharacterized protein G2W53_038576 [Senna tora]